jgi:hypothetical protein
MTSNFRRLHICTILSESLYGPVQSLEVVVRNALHEKLTAAFGTTWYDVPASGLAGHLIDRVTAAKDTEGLSAWHDDEYFRGYCERQLSILGESMSKLGTDFGYEARYPEVEWPLIRGFRHFLVDNRSTCHF